MVTTMTPFCASRSPQDKGIEADPLMYPPRYIQTITGRCSCAVLVGFQMLRNRWNRDCPCVALVTYVKGISLGAEF